MPALPPRAHQAVLEGRALLLAQVPGLRGGHRPPQPRLPARRARPRPDAPGLRVPEPAAGEAEGPPHLRRLEKQFRNLYEEANRESGITGENLLRMLEMRLDNVVFRAGWGASRAQARQFVRHGHVRVNGKRVTIPSYRVRKGDVVTLKEASRQMFAVRRNMDTLDRQRPPWLEAGDAGFAVSVLNPPLREHIDEPVQEQLIVELYSK